MASGNNSVMILHQPSGLKRGRAAAHCDVSPGHFDKMVKEGVLPQPRHLGGVKIWLRQELDEALYSLNSPETEGANSCDAAFGISG